MARVIKHKLVEIDESKLSEQDLYLIYLTEKGIMKRYWDDGAGEGFIKERVTHEALYELSVIISKGFTDYFLILADMGKYCEANDIPLGVGRGSAAGSTVAYALGITEVDPIRFNLIFDRFLNAGRNEMPD